MLLWLQQALLTLLLPTFLAQGEGKEDAGDMELGRLSAEPGGGVILPGLRETVSLG